MATIVTRAGKGSALTFTEMDSNFSNLNTDKLENISEDTTPQLGGNLDVNGNAIVSASNGNIAITPNGTGSIVLDGVNWPQADGTTGQYLKTDGAGNLSWDDPDTDTNTTYTVSAVDSGSNAIIRLTGSDASTDDVVLVAGTNITITPSGDNITIDASGGIALTDLSVGAEGSASGDGAIAYNNTTGVFTYTPPTAAGIGALANVVEDTTPQLGGNLDGQGNKIIDVQLEGYKETIYSLGTTDTPSIDVGNGNVQSVTITSGLTLPDLTSVETGQSVTLIVVGSGTIVDGSSGGDYVFAGGLKTLTNESIVSIFYDGTTYYASVATDFQ